MAVNIFDADSYIELNVIVAEDWADCDDEKKQRILNVAAATLARVYPTYVIPDDAVYEYGAVLATVYNDTNVQRQNGVKSFAVSGISFTFGRGKETIESLIPTSARALIGTANNVKIAGRIKWTVL
jgi:hypothetical protein